MRLIAFLTCILFTLIGSPPAFATDKEKATAGTNEITNTTASNAGGAIYHLPIYMHAEKDSRIKLPMHDGAAPFYPQGNNDERKNENTRNHEEGDQP